MSDPPAFSFCMLGQQVGNHTQFMWYWGPNARQTLYQLIHTLAQKFLTV